MHKVIGGSSDISGQLVHMLFAPGNLFSFLAFSSDVTFSDGGDDLQATPRDLPDGFLPMTSTSTSTRQKWPYGHGYRYVSDSPPLSPPPPSTATAATRCPARRVAAAAARATVTGPPPAIHPCPPPPDPPVFLTRPAEHPQTLGWVTIQRQSLGTRTSGPLENTAATDPPPTVTVRQSFGTRGSGPLENTITAVPPPTSLRPLTPAGRARPLRPLAPAGRAPPPSRPLAPAGRAPPRDPVPPAPCGGRGRRGRTSSRACSTPTQTSWPTSSPPLAGTCSCTVSSRTSSSGTPGCSSRRIRQGSFLRGCTCTRGGMRSSPMPQKVL